MMDRGSGNRSAAATSSTTTTFQDLRHLEELQQQQHHLLGQSGLHLTLGAALGGSGSLTQSVPRGAAKRKAASASFPVGLGSSLNVATLAANAANSAISSHLAIPPQQPSSPGGTPTHINSGPGRDIDDTCSFSLSFSQKIKKRICKTSLSLSWTPLSPPPLHTHSHFCKVE